MGDMTHLRAGEMVGPYLIIDPRGFCGVLPTAVIIDGSANAGIPVILPHRQEVGREDAS